jgi:hypothetical protein
MFPLKYFKFTNLFHFKYKYYNIYETIYRSIASLCLKKLHIRTSDYTKIRLSGNFTRHEMKVAHVNKIRTPMKKGTLVIFSLLFFSIIKTKHGGE